MKFVPSLSVMTLALLFAATATFASTTGVIIWNQTFSLFIGLPMLATIMAANIFVNRNRAVKVRVNG